MKWKNNKENSKEVQKKQSVSSTTSMSILRDENLTFHRFAGADMSIDSRRTSADERHHQHQHLDYGVDANNLTGRSLDKFATAITSKPTSMATLQPPLPPPSSSIWTTTSTSTSHKNNYTTETNDFQYVPSSEISKNGAQSNSMAKLMPIEEETNQQSKCSICRNIIFCLCLNVTYANVVRFPREFERYGIAFLIPYFTILLLIGLPIILLEISLGQFLGQGAAHSWRASPILRGASIIGRIASWLCTIWTSLQAIIGVVYIGELIFKPVPFNHCASKVRLDATNGYVAVANSGQECMDYTFLTPVWEHSLYFSLLTMSLVAVWILSMICTYSGKTLRRSILLYSITAIILLSLLTGWKLYNFLMDDHEFDLLSFDYLDLQDSSIWFNALVQVIFSTTIGTGVWPVITGKFLYKGDAVRTSMVYLMFNVLISAVATSFFFVNYNNPVTSNATILYPELMPLTVIYDSALMENDPLMARVLAGLSYLIIILVSIITIAICIYTSSRMIRRHPNFILSFAGLMTSVASLLCPSYIVPRLLDTRIVGVFVICALIFDIISITWVYGAKSIYTDLEFSIGRPIWKIWVFMWCITPVALIGLLIWWAIAYDATDLFIEYIPRWAPIVVSLSFILILACVEVYKQVDYNCCSMIQEAAHPSKDWGPGDPIVRHAWKQWTSVCEDTGQKDFTLRRRGTRDYTHSIKRGQYSRTNPDHINYRKTSTPGNSSPNCSGSVFDDSAIEEDAVSGYNSHFNAYSSNGNYPLRQSNRSRKTSTTDSPRSALHEKQRQIYANAAAGTTGSNQRPLKKTSSMNGTDDTYTNYVSKIEIGSADTEQMQIIDYRRSIARQQRNVAIPSNNYNSQMTFNSQPISSYGSFRNGVHQDRPDRLAAGDLIDANGKKYSTEEFSTEL